jgi:hypothetical protein
MRTEVIQDRTVGTASAGRWHTVWGHLCSVYDTVLAELDDVAEEQYGVILFANALRCSLRSNVTNPSVCWN